MPGAYKTARKAVGLYRLSVKGTAAHSGVDFEKGHSAVVELARQIEVLHSLTDLSKGITVNPGVIGGGTLSNVVAAEAGSRSMCGWHGSRTAPGLIVRCGRSSRSIVDAS